MCNGVATMVVAKWDDAINMRRVTRILNGETVQGADAPDEVLVPEACPAAAGRGDLGFARLEIVLQSSAKFQYALVPFRCMLRPLTR